MVVHVAKNRPYEQRKLSLDCFTKGFQEPARMNMCHGK